jgi:hypothetical protein
MARRDKYNGTGPPLPELIAADAIADSRYGWTRWQIILFAVVAALVLGF